MDSNIAEYIIVFVASYILTVLSLLAYKAALNDLNIKNMRRAFLELRAVHPPALLTAGISLIPVAVVRASEDTKLVTCGVIGGVALYFVLTLLYRRFNGLKLMDFSIDTGSSFNDEISADPTAAQKLWLFLVSWAGAVVMGTIFGFVIGYNSWKDNASWLSDQPSDTEARVYLLIFLGLIVLSLGLFGSFRSRKLRKLPTAARVRRAVNRSWFLPSIFGLMIAALMDFTRNTTLTNRYWVIVFFVWIVVVELWNFVFVAPNLKRHLAEDRRFFEQQQQRVRRIRNKRRRANRKRR